MEIFPDVKAEEEYFPADDFKSCVTAGYEKVFSFAKLKYLCENVRKI